MPQVQDSIGLQQGIDSGNKDENAVNHEIATLLLNLASRTQGNEPVYISKSEINPRHQNSSAITTPEFEAMDLSTCSKPLCDTSTVRVKPNDETNNKPTNSSSNCSSSVSSNFHNSSTTVPTSVNPYCLFTPNLAMASMANNPMAGLGSTYLLQNLLLGKMHQQIAANTNSTYSTGSSQCCGGLSSTMSPSSTFSNSVTSVPVSTSIPLLSGQIVAQLNGLLFMVHGLTDKAVEINIQGQLAAIYTRLQEIVAMVELTKQKESKNTSKALEDSNCQNPQQAQHHSGSKSEIELMKGTKQKEEESITRQLEEYQKALVHSQNTEESQLVIGSPYVSGVVSSTAARTKQVSVETVGGHSPPSSMESNCGRCSPSPHDLADSSSISASAAARRRRGRPPKENGSPYEIHSPPEKRSRASPESLTSVGSTPTSTSMPPGSTRSKGGKGGKGIRNRVFCGDCPGCLKNDDCGQCRYCRDKTKFGGQNRLRQKCLHRRCQMDTHRRASSAVLASASSPVAAIVTTQSPTSTQQSQTQIYGGVELARLANNHQTHQININVNQQNADLVNSKYASGSLSPGEVVRSPSGHPIYTSFLSNPSLLTPVSKANLTDVSLKEAPLTTSLLQQYQHHNGNNLVIAGGSDEDTDEGEERRPLLSQQSRIDKWKAKHEAMLKMVQNTGGQKTKNKQLNQEKPMQNHQVMEDISKKEKHIEHRSVYAETVNVDAKVLHRSPTQVTSSLEITQKNHINNTHNITHVKNINNSINENNIKSLADSNKDGKITQSNKISIIATKHMESLNAIPSSNTLDKAFPQQSHSHGQIIQTHVDMDLTNSQKIMKSEQIKQEKGRLTTRSMKTVVAV